MGLAGSSFWNDAAGEAVSEQELDCKELLLLFLTQENIPSKKVAYREQYMLQT